MPLAHGSGFGHREDEVCSGKMIRLPNMEEIGIPVIEQLIVELYSK